MGNKILGAAGLELIKSFEGCRLTAYKPVPTEKYWTIGWGHYGADVSEGMTITQAQADALLVKDCAGSVAAVNNKKYCPITETLNQNQFDALVSFTFNCGSGGLQMLCKNRTAVEIAEKMLLYNKGGGKVLPGLVRRRKAEQDLFNKAVKGEDDMVYYKTINDVPKHYKPSIQKLINDGILKGTGNNEINVSEDFCRIMTVLDRKGLL